mmetsp:Transcript_41886/g.131298  ORF Transcript_41886/g.131298 Transcript_41886/m.131298 type:complete len:210 (-) Transcript_41886:63-692(-)
MRVDGAAARRQDVFRVLDVQRPGPLHRGAQAGCEGLCIDAAANRAFQSPARAVHERRRPQLADDAVGRGIHLLGHVRRREPALLVVRHRRSERCSPHALQLLFPEEERVRGVKGLGFRVRVRVRVRIRMRVSVRVRVRVRDANLARRSRPPRRPRASHHCPWRRGAVRRCSGAAPARGPRGAPRASPASRAARSRWRTDCRGGSRDPRT